MKRENQSMETINTEMNNQYNENMTVPVTNMQTNKKHGNKRRFLLLVILLICTVALLGGATYAWFTANTLVRVQELQINVTVARGIEISSDAKSWGPAMTLEDLYIAGGMTVADPKDDTVEDSGAKNQLPGLLYNISSLGNINDKDVAGSVSKLALFKGTAATMCWVWTDESDKTKGGAYQQVNNGGSGEGVDMSVCDMDYPIKDGLVSSGVYTEQNGSCIASEDTNIAGVTGDKCGEDNQVIAFDMYLKTDATSNVYLQEGSYVKNREGIEDTGLKNTIRVAFVTLGTQPSKFYYAEDDKISATGTYVKGASETLEDYEEDYVGAFGGYAGKYGARTMNEFGEITIWEPNATKHTNKAVEHARKNYNYDDADVKNKYVSTHAIWAAPSGTKNVTMGYKDDTGADQNWTGSINMLPLYMHETFSNTYGEFFAVQGAVDATKMATTQKASDGTTDVSPYKNLVRYSVSNDYQATKVRLFTSPAGVTKVRVYIWVEGSDIDTENNATASTVDVSLMFTTAESSGTPDPNDFIKYNDSTRKANYGTESGTAFANWRTGTAEDAKKFTVGTAA